MPHVRPINGRIMRRVAASGLCALPPLVLRLAQPATQQGQQIRRRALRQAWYSVATVGREGLAVLPRLAAPARAYLLARSSTRLVAAAKPIMQPIAQTLTPAERPGGVAASTSASVAWRPLRLDSAQPRLGSLWWRSLVTRGRPLAGVMVPASRARHGLVAVALVSSFRHYMSAGGFICPPVAV
jgi:hypothetical protein